MTLPQTLDTATPAGTDSPAQGDDRIREIKQFIADVFGITSAASYTGAAFTIATDGTVTFGQPVGLPTGMIVSYGNATAPTGWLLCFGQAVSRSTYSALFAIVSTLYGVGDGSTTFNLPDLRGRIPLGKDDMGGSAASRVASATTMGATGGAQYLQNHAHDMSSHTHTMGNHTHTMGSHTHTLASTASTNTATEGENPNSITVTDDGHLKKIGSTGGGAYGRAQSVTGAPSNNTSDAPSTNTSGGPSTANTGNPTSATVIGMNPWQLAVYIIKI